MLYNDTLELIEHVTVFEDFVIKIWKNTSWTPLSLWRRYYWETQVGDCFTCYSDGYAITKRQAINDGKAFIYDKEYERAKAEQLGRYV